MMTTSPKSRPSAGLRQTREGMLGRVDDLLTELVTREHHRRMAQPQAATLVSGLGELLQARSDRVRPVICLTGYLAAGGDPHDEAALTAAAALELLDTCQVIREDVRENAVLRRSMPTLHISHAAEHERNGWRGESRRFGEGTAVLVGDLATAFGDRLAGKLPAAVAELWGEFRTERIIGAQAEAAAATEYLGDPWPGHCVEGCAAGCGAGWYALRHPLLIGAALAGRPDLVTAYQEYAGALHAAWRLRGFLDGGPGYDSDAQFLREVVFGDQGRREAQEAIAELVARALRSLADAPLAPGGHAELVALAHLVAEGH
ncbi:polyprenyl synthetase family protein [Kitasatospora sp. NBC_01287]|uniref:polyprenyl synthetase family protein n=1 Tax=Kitasatospora sp. NBC_01287 TaxID=2903573 RepID=UPI002251E90E|nr:polyprenyl synthetase family protein [Kitasatospora sp. NBC_01287]MCX4750341.1 polyprenyl synthetase family protein [Kitasatospora sp. NBC_01287]